MHFPMYMEYFVEIKTKEIQTNLMIALFGLDFGSLEIGGLKDFLLASDTLTAIEGINLAGLATADYFYSIDSLFNMLLVFQAEGVVFDDDFMTLIKESVFQHLFASEMK